MTIWSSALVIARRDFTATVFSRSFILFLLGPLMALGFGGLIGRTADSSDNAALRPVLTVVADDARAAEIRRAYHTLSGQIGETNLPVLAIAAPRGDAARQAQAIAARPSPPGSAVLSGWPDAPQLTGAKGAVDELEGRVALLIEKTGTAQTPAIRTSIVAAAPVESGIGRKILARGGQTLLFMLTILLAGMLLSNLVEEKSNKVIEVLASAAPVDAIFIGKLIAMLGVSVTGILLWGGVIGGAVLTLLPNGGAVPSPAVGWPVFGLLIAAYYVMNYMIMGGLFLGIGAQAASVREVQTLSMPVTMAQLAVFALASAAMNAPDGPLAQAASLFPLSSPLTMIGRAAQEGALWPHLAALAWQALWVALIIRFAAARFRKGVLMSGPQPGDKRWSFRRAAH